MMYRGGIGMWSYILHRVAGLGVLVFLFIHILDTVLIGWGPDLYNKVMAIYHHPVFRVGEAGLFGAVLFHALNGIRVILVDLLKGAAAVQREMFYVEAVVFVVVFSGVAFVMLKPVFGGM